MNNPVFIESGQRHRHQVIEQAISDSYDMLALPEVALRLGERTLQLIQILDHLTVPNIRHNVVEPTHQHDDLVEIIALRPDQQVSRRYPNSSFNGIQERYLRREEPTIAEDLISRQLSYYSEHSDLSPVTSLDDLGPGVAAYVASNILPLQNAQHTIHLRGRPLVVINSHNPADRHPALVLHELTHVQQLHRNPITNPFTRLDTIYREDEVEAYHVTAEIIRGQRESQSSLARLDTQTANELLHIDELRSVHQKSKKRPFRVNRSLIKNLNKANHRLIA